MQAHRQQDRSVATILVVEDEPDIRELIAFNLERSGHRVVHATNGERALELMREELPHLVLIDWMLPGMSGIELARSLRSTKRTETIPVIMLTARGTEQ